MNEEQKNTYEFSHNGTDVELDTSVAEARWIFGTVIFLGVLVLSSGVVANALGA